MKVYGLTGGIGMGKSISDQLLRERGVPVVDTDIIARELVAPGQPALEEITDQFGGVVLTREGQLNRSALARIVFGNEKKREILEQILHPRIRETWQRKVNAWRGEGKSAAVVVIPLLYETKAEREFDVIVCVACSAATQRERLRGRGWNEQQIGQRIAAQWPISKKMELANFVVWTEGEIGVHTAQLERIVESIAERRA